MPPLDTGSTAHTLRLVDPLNDRAAPTQDDYPSVGAYLRAVRERQGRDLGELADATRIRKAYLGAIEEGQYDTLPSRPFAIGYVRAYGDALGADGEACAARFKAETPDTSEPLRAPVGVKHEHPERRPLFFAAAGLIVVAVVGWNIVQRVLTVEKEPPPPLPAPAAVVEDVPAAPAGPIALSAPTPPPAEQTTPAPYTTPGLAAQAADGTVVHKPGAGIPTPPPATAAATAAAAPVFAAKGAVYGAPVAEAGVVLQARKSASLIVRGPGGEVYFARQLAEGESYHAPFGQKLAADVTDPAAFSVYVEGRLRGDLTTPLTPLDKMAPEPVRAVAEPPAPRAQPDPPAPRPPAE